MAMLLFGGVCLIIAISQLPYELFDYKLAILTVFTIGFGSRITVQIPALKSHISVSDTFIFLALLLYGGEVAVVLAAVEAVFSSWRFCNKKITVFQNAALMAISTTAAFLVLKFSGLSQQIYSHADNENLNIFVLTLLVLGFTQFIANTFLTAIYGAFFNEKPFFETWKTKYLWTFITYLVGAVSAGILFELNHRVGFSVIIAAFPVIYLLYLTYKMYLENVEISESSARKAEEYAETLEKQAVALLESEERFRSAFNYAPIGIALVSSEGKWLKVNHALQQILGYEEMEFLATDFQTMVAEDELGTALVKIHELISGAIPNFQMEQRYLHKSGKIVQALWSVSAAADSNAERPNLIFQIQDITDRKSAEEKLQREATHDALTDLPNRAYFMSRLEEALENVRRSSSHKVSVLFIDLDRFKVVNDSLGHVIGDQLLVGIADRLRDCMRPGDIVARLGGDEFTILVEGRHKLEEVGNIAERIQEKFAEPFDLDGHEIYSSASIGILHASDTHLKPEDLMRDADTAMYQAKHSGKACYKIFNNEMHTAVKETLMLENELRRAIENDQLEVYYQPIYSIAEGEIEGFEALTRWNHETLGAISPVKFIPLAEEVGLIDSLSDFVLKKSCRQINQINANLVGRKPYMLSVNLSCKQFSQSSLVENIENILAETDFSPHLLKLEITESVFFEHKENAVEMLNKLRELGIEINIDDFGTGYSNLSYLTQLPISTLKIDRSFISPLEDGAGSAQVVQTIIALAQNLGIRVVAEGVENEAQLEHLRTLSCEGAQGYFFAKPMSFSDIKTFLKIGDTSLLQESYENLPILSTIQ